MHTSTIVRQACAPQEATRPPDTAEELADMTQDVYLPQLPPAEFPYLNESAEVLVASGYDPTEEFAFGLDLVLAALEPLRAPREGLRNRPRG